LEKDIYNYKEEKKYETQRTELPLYTKLSFSHSLKALPHTAPRKPRSN